MAVKKTSVAAINAALNAAYRNAGDILGHVNPKSEASRLAQDTLDTIDKLKGRK